MQCSTMHAKSEPLCLVRSYWRSTWHRVDGIICVAVTISTISLFLEMEMDITPRSNEPSHRYWEILKVFRALRVFRVLNLLTALQYIGKPDFSIDRYRLIFAVTNHAMSSMFPFAVFLSANFYIFAVAGIDMFGPTLTACPFISQVGLTSQPILTVCWSCSTGGPDGLTGNFDKSCGHSNSINRTLLGDSPLAGAQGYNGASYTSIGVCQDHVFSTNTSKAEAAAALNIEHCLLGGDLASSAGAASEACWGSSVPSYYYGINFDSMGAAYVSLLHLLIMNNWHVTHEVCFLPPSPPHPPTHSVGLIVLVTLGRSLTRCCVCVAAV